MNDLGMCYNGSDARNERLHLLVSNLPLSFELDRRLPIFLKKCR